MLQQVRCGSLSVLENRSRPEGPRLRIAVVVLKSLSTTPKSDAIVWVAGGPGESVVVRAAVYIRSGVLNHWRAERDIVLYDQRGAGFSEPRLCPEEAPNWQARPNQEDGAAFRVRRQEMAARCSESVRRAGFDLSQYNSAVSALDLQDLRVALGYAQWNLYGPSYGARLALVAMRGAPQGIRSAILAAPFPPPNVPCWANEAGAVFDVIQRLSAACALQPSCNAAFPDVEQTLWRTVEELDREPWIFQRTFPDGRRIVVTTTGARAVGFLLTGSNLPPASPRFRCVSVAIRARDDALLNALLTSAAPAAPADAPVSGGMHFAVQCFDDAPLSTPELFERARRSFPAVLVDGGLFGEPSLCENLHPFRASAAQLAPVLSDIPTLVFTGEFDPIAHRSNGPAIQSSLKNSQVFEIRGATHNGGGFREHQCTRTMSENFLNAPMQKLEAGNCLASIPPLQFVTTPPVNSAGR